MKTFPGLLDRVSFPPGLTAQVVEPTPDPRIHGYAVQADLGHHAGFADVVWLSLTGELPSPTERDAFSRALTWLAPVHAGEGSAHAAILAKVAGAPEATVPGIAVVALGQQITAELRALEPLFAWLPSPASGPLPEGVVERVPTVPQREAWARLCSDALGWFGETPFTEDLVWQREPAAYALLHALGFQDTPRLQALATWARLPVILAEAACIAPGAVMRYPTHTPPYQYGEEL